MSKQTFVVFAKGFILACYVKNGKEIPTPRKRFIYFKNKDKRRRPLLATYKTDNEATIKYIKKSPFFNKIIFKIP